MTMLGKPFCLGSSCKFIADNITVYRHTRLMLRMTGSGRKRVSGIRAVNTYIVIIYLPLIAIGTISRRIINIYTVLCRPLNKLIQPSLGSCLKSAGIITVGK